SEAEMQAQAGYFDEAIKSYEQALQVAASDERGLFYLKSRLKQVQWQKQFDSGDWVQIQPEKDFAAWCPIQGDWKLDDDGNLVGTADSAGLMILCQAVFFG